MLVSVLCKHEKSVAHSLYVISIYVDCHILDINTTPTPPDLVCACDRPSMLTHLHSTHIHAAILIDTHTHNSQSLCLAHICIYNRAHIHACGWSCAKHACMYGGQK